MTMKEAAAKYGVSRQAIYQKLKRQGLQVDTLRDPATGDFTPEGEEVLSSLFTPADTTTDNTDKRVDELTADVNRLQAEVDRLTAQIDTLTAQLTATTDERDFLRRALDQAQQLHAMALKALPQPREPESVMSKIRHIFKR